ncbi:hypothetical protein NP493_1010g00000 [Ridgeia piscesae]|uniref:Sodium/calcium exchanger membrane region domain-containing protein n=1 Tax=Ridgeia piscesae TaxID=27915 RepID=A0AAD9KI18_RIDPI|nr:hypothetical protein NP493_1010g00000 [Ridgeia piscesae]
MVVYHYTNYTRGWVVEVLGDKEKRCHSYLLLPAENLWGDGVRGFLYILALLYIFMGVAIISDIFMFAIEVITSKRKTIVRWDEETHERVQKEVLVWNETVANLTLMALGSSAPEILLAVIETVQTLDMEADSGGLGTFTIIGSAAFNLLIITAVCVYSVPSPNIKKVRGLSVFALTSCWSIFAYVWMLVVLQWVSPGEIEPWEAWLTLAFFPIMVLTAYCQDSRWWCLSRKTAVGHLRSHTVSLNLSLTSLRNVRVLEDNPHGIMHGAPRELIALEQEKRTG